MQIPNQLPQFKNKKTLLAVCGNQSGIFYLAQNGTVEKIKEIEVETPRYSDKEGFFTSNAPGGQSITGAVREPDKHHVWDTFINQASQYLDGFHKKEGFASVWLYCAPEIINDFKEKLPRSIQDLISKEFRGTYLKLDLPKLLELAKK